jgi:hypothetical protein
MDCDLIGLSVGDECLMEVGEPPMWVPGVVKSKIGGLPHPDGGAFKNSFCYGVKLDNGPTLGALSFEDPPKIKRRTRAEHLGRGYSSAPPTSSGN